MKIDKTYKAKFYGGTRNQIKYIVVHYTANSGMTATAKGNANYFSNTDRKASAHYVIDEHDTIYQCVEDNVIAWAVGDEQKYTNGGASMKGIITNANSISIEMVSHTDADGNYFVPEATLSRTVDLIKALIKKYNLTEKAVYRHYDVTGKLCPKPLVDATAWNNFKLRLKEEEEMIYATYKDLPKWYQEGVGYFIKNGDLNDGTPLDGQIDQNFKINLAESTARALQIQYNAFVRLKLI